MISSVPFVEIEHGLHVLCLCQKENRFRGRSHVLIGRDICEAKMRQIVGSSSDTTKAASLFRYTSNYVNSMCSLNTPKVNGSFQVGGREAFPHSHNKHEDTCKG